MLYLQQVPQAPIDQAFAPVTRCAGPNWRSIAAITTNRIFAHEFKVLYGIDATTY